MQSPQKPWPQLAFHTDSTCAGSSAHTVHTCCLLSELLLLLLLLLLLSLPLLVLLLLLLPSSLSGLVGA